VTGVLAALFGAAAIATLTTGAVAVPPLEALAVVARKAGLGALGEPGRQAEAVVWGIRMPRLLTACTVGAGLAATGAVLQGMLRNEMADPQLLGIGPGAGIGAVIGSAAGGVQGAIAGGIVSGVVTGFVVRRLGSRVTIDRTRLILSGVALGAALSAWVGFLVFAADRSRVPPIEFWLLGSLSGSTWRSFGTAAVMIGAGALVLLGTSRSLDLMSLGHSEARHLGVDTDLVATIVLIAVGIVVGATVGAVGVVAFVGLLVPYWIRRLVGPAHRRLMGVSALGGAVLLVLSDLVARLTLEPVEIPVGLVTSALGGPLFLWLISRTRDV
jgi:iron complex transport system permease protein